jgi:hypothetical protein
MGLKLLVPERELRKVTESARTARRINATTARSGVVALVCLLLGRGAERTDNGVSTPGLVI